MAKETQWTKLLAVLVDNVNKLCEEGRLIDALHCSMLGINKKSTLPMHVFWKVVLPVLPNVTDYLCITCVLPILHVLPVYCVSYLCITYVLCVLPMYYNVRVLLVVPNVTNLSWISFRRQCHRIWLWTNVGYAKSLCHLVSGKYFPLCWILWNYRSQG